MSKPMTFSDIFWLVVLGAGVLIWSALALIGAFHLYEALRSVFSRSVM